jgi:replicative superfamily II helicase
MPLHDIFGSVELSKKWTQMISKYGTREIKIFEKETEGIFELIKRRQEEERSYTVIQDNSNFIIALGILELLRKYVKYLTHEIPLIELIEYNNSLSESNNILDIESWLSIFTKLLSNTINYNIEHSIIKLNLPRSFEQKIIHKGISELWKPQIEAIDKGLMQNQNLVYSTETGSGKSLLAYLLSSKATPENKVIYISPTKTLTKEAYNTINELLKDENKKIAISTRDETKYDDKLFESSIILSTYEKFYSIMKKNQIKREHINTLVADEVHFLSDPERGIPL